jgi:alpha-beta hydrolase superfamily lysophospholipase
MTLPARPADLCALGNLRSRRSFCTDRSVARAAALSVPALLLHGTEDGPAEGGSDMTTVARARAFEEALLAANKVVEDEYFEGARHSALFYNADQRAHTVRRVAEFLRRQGFE